MSIREVPSFDPSAIGPATSYSTRARPETSREVIRNRVGVTASFFGIAMTASYLLGRRSG